MVKLSEFEKDILDELKTASNVKTIVGNTDTRFCRKYPDVKYGNVTQALNNIKEKFKEAQSFIGLIHSYRGLSPILKKVLTIRVAQKEETFEDEENAEKN